MQKSTGATALAAPVAPASPDSVLVFVMKELSACLIPYQIYLTVITNVVTKTWKSPVIDSLLGRHFKF